MMVRRVARYCMPDPTAAVTDELIKGQINPGSRVIDFGCGDGRLLRNLRDEHECSIAGVELNPDLILAAISNGVPVLHADLDRGLRDIVPDRSFDYAVLSQTLQQVRRPRDVLLEMQRIARWSFVVVPNFGYWRVRLQVMRLGRAPVTESLPYEWYNTPNLHFLSLYDFHDLAERLDFRILKVIHVINDRALRRTWAANWRAQSALFVLESPTTEHRR